jgi:hypothetical protein
MQKIENFSYNKTINTASPGTLIANWYEERELR